MSLCGPRSSASDHHFRALAKSIFIALGIIGVARSYPDICLPPTSPNRRVVHAHYTHHHTFHLLRRWVASAPEDSTAVHRDSSSIRWSPFQNHDSSSPGDSTRRDARCTPYIRLLPKTTASRQLAESDIGYHRLNRVFRHARSVDRLGHRLLGLEFATACRQLRNRGCCYLNSRTTQVCRPPVAKEKLECGRRQWLL